MSDEYGHDFITITDEDGNEFELEHLDTVEQGGRIYMAFLPADMDEDDEDFGLVILRAGEKDGEEVLTTLDDDDELERIFGRFIERLSGDFSGDLSDGTDDDDEDLGEDLDEDLDDDLDGDIDEDLDDDIDEDLDGEED